MDPRRRNHVEEAGTCIPGLGDNKPRPRKTNPYYIMLQNLQYKNDKKQFIQINNKLKG